MPTAFAPIALDHPGAVRRPVMGRRISLVGCPNSGAGAQGNSRHVARQGQPESCGKRGTCDKSSALRHDQPSAEGQRATADNRFPKRKARQRALVIPPAAHLRHDHDLAVRPYLFRQPRLAMARGVGAEPMARMNDDLRPALCGNLFGGMMATLSRGRREACRQQDAAGKRRKTKTNRHARHRAIP